MTKKRTVKDAFIGIRVSKSFKNQLLKDSRIADKSLADYVRICCTEYVKRTVGVDLLPLYMMGRMLGLPLFGFSKSKGKKLK